MQADAAPPGVVELREDIPLKPGGGGGGGGASCGGGPRLIAGCFAALTAAVTVALLTQIYYGDYEVVPHGAVSAPAAACSAAGTGALKAGGRAADAAAAAALCLALLAPHKTSLDASGSLLYWEYRTARGAGPTLMEWGGPEDSGGPDSPDGTGGTGGTGGPGGPPRLLAALAALHSRWGALPWHRVLQPTIDLARSGFEVSEELAAARAQTAAAPRWEPGALRTDEPFAAYLEALQRNTSAELWSAWRGRGARVREAAARSAAAGAWRLHAGGAGAEAAARALGLALDPPPASVDDAEARVVKALVAEAALGAWPPSGAGLAAGCGLAVVDRLDTYLALVTGLSVPFGSEAAAGAGAGVEARDRPVAPLDLAPAILVDDHV